MTNEDIFKMLDYPKAEGPAPIDGKNGVEVLRSAHKDEFLFALSRFGKSLPKAETPHFQHKVILTIDGSLYLIKMKKQKAKDAA